MASLFYKITGNPIILDDLKLLARGIPKPKFFLKIHEKKSVREDFTVCRYFAEVLVRWSESKKKPRTFYELCAGQVVHAPAFDRVEKSKLLTSANRQLEKFLANLMALEIKLENPEKRFADPLAGE